MMLRSLVISGIGMWRTSFFFQMLDVKHDYLVTFVYYLY